VAVAAAVAICVELGFVETKVGMVTGMLVVGRVGAAVGLGVQPERTRHGRNNKIKMDLIIFDGCIVFLLGWKMLIKPIIL
jgi:hypothetical protein